MTHLPTHPAGWLSHPEIWETYRIAAPLEISHPPPWWGRPQAPPLLPMRRKHRLLRMRKKPHWHRGPRLRSRTRLRQSPLQGGFLPHVGRQVAPTRIKIFFPYPGLTLDQIRGMYMRNAGLCSRASSALAHGCGSRQQASSARCEFCDNCCWGIECVVDKHCTRPRLRCARACMPLLCWAAVIH